jgi:hypothetical protein
MTIVGLCTEFWSMLLAAAGLFVNGVLLCSFACVLAELERIREALTEGVVNVRTAEPTET